LKGIVHIQVQRDSRRYSKQQQPQKTKDIAAGIGIRAGDDSQIVDDSATRGRAVWSMKGKNISAGFAHKPAVNALGVEVISWYESGEINTVWV
jgi:hypothetical protein